VVSTAGLRGKNQEAGYCASKFGVRGFTEALKAEYQHSEPTIIGAYMGGMNTPFWDESDYVKDPSGLASPDDIASVILDQYKNGKDIIIDKD
jgi:short-subunit dehydrogenase